MQDLYKKIDKLIVNCLDECNLHLPDNFCCYSTFFENKISSIIIMYVSDKEENDLNKVKIVGKEVYEKLKKNIFDKKLNKYLILTEKPYIEQLTYDKKYNILYYINIYLGKIDDCLEGYLKLIEN